MDNQTKGFVGGLSPVRTIHIAFLFFLCFTFSYIDRQIVSIMVEPLKQHLKLSDGQIGLLQGLSFTLCYATAGVVVSHLVDRSNRVRLIAVCVTIWSISTVASGFAQSFSQLLVARAGTAIAEAALSPAALSIFSDLYPPRRLARANSLFMLGPYLGGGIALLGGGLLLDHLAAAPFSLAAITLEPWQWTFVAVGLPGFVLAGLIALTVREPARKATATDLVPADKDIALGTLPSLRQVIREVAIERKFCRSFFLAYMFLIATFYGNAVWFPTVLIRHFGISPSEVGMLAGPAYILGGMCGVLYASYIMQNMNGDEALTRVLGIPAKAAFCLVPLAVAAPLVPSLKLAVVLYGLTAFAASMCMALAPAPIQLALPNRMRGRAIALLFMTNAVGGSIAPFLIGEFSERLAPHNGLGVALSLCAGIAAIASSFWYYLSMRQSRLDRWRSASTPLVP